MRAKNNYEVDENTSRLASGSVILIAHGGGAVPRNNTKSKHTHGYVVVTAVVEDALATDCSARAVRVK